MTLIARKRIVNSLKREVSVEVARVGPRLFRMATRAVFAELSLMYILVAACTVGRKRLVLDDSILRLVTLLTLNLFMLPFDLEVRMKIVLKLHVFPIPVSMAIHAIF